MSHGKLLGVLALKRIVGDALPSKRIKELYSLEKEWRNMALDQTIKNIDEIKNGTTKVKSLVDKLSSEVIEMEGALKYHIGSMSGKHKHDAIEEIGDVINMARLLLPIHIPVNKIKKEQTPSYSDMLTSMNYHKDRYGFTPLVIFDASEAPRRQLFERYVKAVESVQIQEKAKYGADYKNEMYDEFHETYLMLHHDIDEYLDQNKFKNWNIRMGSKWTRMMGDIITRSLILLRGVADASYENLYISATKKMKERDKRYHGINRRDQ